MQLVTALGLAPESPFARAPAALARARWEPSEAAEPVVEAWCGLVLALSLAAADSAELRSARPPAPSSGTWSDDSALSAGIALAERFPQLGAARNLLVQLSKEDGTGRGQLVARAVEALQRSEGVNTYSRLQFACKLLLGDIGRRFQQVQVSSSESGTFLRVAAHLQIERTVAWFALNDGPAIDLRRRRSLRLLLRHLVAAWDRQPGEPTSLAQIVEAGWPGERLQAQSGAQRAYVAIAALRKMGLKDLLLTEGDGYLLTPSVRVTYVD